MVAFSILLFLVSSMACSQKNAHYEQMKDLADKARSPSTESPNALSKLMDFSRSENYWDRYYALVFLGQLALVSNSDTQKQIIPIIISTLDDKDQAVRRSAVCVIRDVGTNAVDQAIPKLLQFVRSGDEIDVSWFATEALGKSQDSRYQNEVVSTLFSALDQAPSVELPASAPQIRYYALSALAEIGERNPTVVLPELRKRAATKDRALSDKIAATITRLEKKI